MLSIPFLSYNLLPSLRVFSLAYPGLDPLFLISYWQRQNIFWIFHLLPVGVVVAVVGNSKRRKSNLVVSKGSRPAKLHNVESLSSWRQTWHRWITDHSSQYHSTGLTVGEIFYNSDNRVSLFTIFNRNEQ